MSIAAFLPFLGPIMRVIEKVVPDPQAQAQIKAELMKESLNAESEFYRAAGSIITAEAQGESWMQRNWRPITMLTFVFIIANNYILVPWIEFIGGLFGYAVLVPVLEIPEGLWGLLQIGIGGYIASRGVEKVVKSTQTGGTPLIGSRAAPANTISKDDLDESNKALLQEMRSLR